MDQSKRGQLLVSHGLSLSKDMCPKTQDERDHMSQILFTSAVRSFMFLEFLRPRGSNIKHKIHMNTYDEVVEYLHRAVKRRERQQKSNSTQQWTAHSGSELHLHFQF